MKLLKLYGTGGNPIWINVDKVVAVLADHGNENSTTLLFVGPADDDHFEIGEPVKEVVAMLEEFE